MQALPGFRDFLPKNCAARNYIFACWREISQRNGFVEWDGPILEPTELYKKKSGTEIIDQLFNFADKGEREVALRPELTPTLARVIAAHEREFKKPLKWFSIGRFFRHEKQQRGRLREHFQLNCDIVGESALAADIEVLALCIDLLRAFGFTEKDVVIRISDRGLADFVVIDVGVVRGLAYYTGIVFEVFDRARKLRAVAGGGRYDNLIAQLSDGAVSMPALGFAMGDVVLGELIRDHEGARKRMEQAIAAEHKIDIYIVIAKEERRPDALAHVQQIRDRGYRVDYPLAAEKVAKQFQTAEQLGARFAILFGDEWPQVAIKDLTHAEQQLVAHGDLFTRIDSLLR